MSWCNIVTTTFIEFGDHKNLRGLIDDLYRWLDDGLSYPSEDIEHRVAWCVFRGLKDTDSSQEEISKWAEKIHYFVRHSKDIRFQCEAAFDLIYWYHFLGDHSKAAVLLQAVEKMSDEVRMQQPIPGLLLKVNEAYHNFLVWNKSACFDAVASGLALSAGSGVRFADHLMLSSKVCWYLSEGSISDAKKALAEVAPALNGGATYEKFQYHYLAASIALLERDFPLAHEHAQISLASSKRCGALQKFVPELLLTQIFHQRGEKQQAQACLANTFHMASQSGSALLRYSCLLVQAQISFDNGDEQVGVDALREAMYLGRGKHFLNAWGWIPAVMTRLCMKALMHEIEIEYVHELIQKRALIPEEPPLAISAWPFKVRVYTLGQFAVEVNGEPLKFGRKTPHKPLELLRALIAFGGKNLSEERLMETLWAEADGDAARMALKSAVHRLRHLLNKEAIELHDGLLSLNPYYCWVDVWAVEQLFTQMAGQDKSADDVQHICKKVVSLYRGPFLPDGDDAPWKKPLRLSLQRKIQQCLLKHGNKLIERGQLNQAIDVYEKGVEVDPAGEVYYCQLMACFSALGRQSEALNVYHQCRSVLDAELATVPSADTEALYNAIRAGIPVSHIPNNFNLVQ